MAEFLTAIALQMRGALMFVLGLAGMYTVAKNLFVATMTLPRFKDVPLEVEVPARRLRRKLYWLAGLSIVLFASAIVLYFFSPVASINPDALRTSGGLLTGDQQIAFAALLAVGVAVIVCEVRFLILRPRLDKLKTG